MGAGFAGIYDTLEVTERPAGPATAAIVPQSLRSIGGFSQQLAWWLGTLQYLLAT